MASNDTFSLSHLDLNAEINNSFDLNEEQHDGNPHIVEEMNTGRDIHQGIDEP